MEKGCKRPSAPLPSVMAWREDVYVQKQKEIPVIKHFKQTSALRFGRCSRINPISQKTTHCYSSPLLKKYGEKDDYAPTLFDWDYNVYLEGWILNVFHISVKPKAFVFRANKRQRSEKAYLITLLKLTQRSSPGKKIAVEANALIDIIVAINVSTRR